MGPAYMSGYQGSPAETRAAVDDHGYFRTGDLAYLDQDGYLYLVDRIKDSLKFDGVPVRTNALFCFSGWHLFRTCAMMSFHWSRSPPPR